MFLAQPDKKHLRLQGRGAACATDRPALIKKTTGELLFKARTRAREKNDSSDTLRACVCESPVIAKTEAPGKFGSGSQSERLPIMFTLRGRKGIVFSPQRHNLHSREGKHSHSTLRLCERKCVLKGALVLFVMSQKGTPTPLPWRVTAPQAAATSGD